MARRTFAMAFGAGLFIVACGGSDEGGDLFGSAGQAGSSGSAGASGGTGGAGGSATGGTGGGATGGTGGGATGGTGGTATGGSAGAATGGSAGAGTGGSGTGGSGTGGSGTGGSAGGTGGSGGGCTAVTWCKDGDDDGYGDPATEVDACTSPGSNYVDKSSKPRACEDCNDANKLVHPNSTHCDGVGYSLGGGKVSFDFNCDDKEVACHDFKKAAANGCMLDGTGGSLGCSGSGYLPTGRTGPGVDPYCGSDEWRSCQLSGDPGSPGCKSSVLQYNPVTCK